MGSSVEGLDVDRMLDRRGAMSAALEKSEASAAAAGIDGTPSFQVGPTGGRLRRVSITSLDAGALRPAIEALLAR